MNITLAIVQMEELKTIIEEREEEVGVQEVVEEEVGGEQRRSKYSIKYPSNFSHQKMNESPTSSPITKVKQIKGIPWLPLQRLYIPCSDCSSKGNWECTNSKATIL